MAARSASWRISGSPNGQPLHSSERGLLTLGASLLVHYHYIGVLWSDCMRTRKQQKDCPIVSQPLARGSLVFITAECVRFGAEAKMPDSEHGTSSYSLLLHYASKAPNRISHDVELPRRVLRPRDITPAYVPIPGAAPGLKAGVGSDVPSSCMAWERRAEKW